jgi:hypothetical protein
MWLKDSLSLSLSLSLSPSMQLSKFLHLPQSHLILNANTFNRSSIDA